MFGDLFGDAVARFFAGALDDMMLGLWNAALSLLRVVFEIVDRFTAFTVADQTGQLSGDSPIAVFWPLLRSISLPIALGLFFWQLIATVLRGGRGFWRATIGPVAYGIALTSTVGIVAILLLAADGLTQILLEQGLRVENFGSILANNSIGGIAVEGIGGVVLGVTAIFGVVPAAFGYLLEMLFRQAAILVLVATTPITAAGLLAETTKSWYWRALRWTLAAILMKPVLALAIVLGVSMVGKADGLPGLLVGVGVLLISLFCPFVLFRLFAFVDPNTDPGAGFRDWLQQTAANLGSSGGSSGASGSGSGGGGGGGGGGGSMESANYARFDQSIADYSNSAMDDTHVGSSSAGQSGNSTAPSDGGPSSSNDASSNDASANGSSSGGSSGSAPSSGDTSTDPGSGGDAVAAAPSAGSPPAAGTGSEHGSGGDAPGDSAPPQHPAGHADEGGERGGHGSGGGAGGGRGSGGGGSAAGTAEEAAVIV